MSKRAAAIPAAILASFGLAVAIPVVAHTGGVSAAQAGGDTQTVTTPGPTQTVTTPAPAPSAPSAPSDTLQQTTSSPRHSGRSSSGSGSAGKKGSTERNEGREVTTHRSLNLRTREVSNTTTMPRGGVQAGGGGTAPIAKDASSSQIAVGVGTGLVLLLTGTGLALRRRVGAH